jgi:hypothetical protein
MAAVNSNESYCTFTLASDVTAGGLPSEADIAKDLESSDENVSDSSPMDDNNHKVLSVLFGRFSCVAFVG